MVNDLIHTKISYKRTVFYIEIAIFVKAYNNIYIIILFETYVGAIQNLVENGWQHRRKQPENRRSSISETRRSEVLFLAPGNCTRNRSRE